MPEDWKRLTFLWQRMGGPSAAKAMERAGQAVADFASQPEPDVPLTGQVLIRHYRGSQASLTQ
jgi:hypothetical protein